MCPRPSHLTQKCDDHGAFAGSHGSQRAMRGVERRPLRPSQPFKLPNFYLGWPARLNPNVETARRHTVAWSREVGILDDAAGGSHARDLDRGEARGDGLRPAVRLHPPRRAGARARPGHRLVRLGLLLRRSLPRRLQAHSRSRRRASAPRTPAAVHADRPDADRRRSRPTQSSAASSTSGGGRFRRRHSRGDGGSSRAPRPSSTSPIWELRNIDAGRVANPVEYIEMRRKVGGAPWSAHLVEHANFVEVPDRIYDSRPMRVLKETFADAVHLRNDLFSYEREILDEGELSNCVLVLERFFDIRHADRGRHDQRGPQLAPLPVREHRAHRGAGPDRGVRASTRSSGRASRCTSRASRTGSPAATSGTCSRAAT